MVLKWIKDPRVLVAIDFALGVASFSFQVAFLASYLIITNYDQAGTGIWAGIVFIATAAVAWTLDGKVDRLILAVGPCLSFICAIILFSLNIAALKDLDSICPIKFIDYHCSTEIGLDVMLMLCGLFAIPVNALLALFVFGVMTPAGS